MKQLLFLFFLLPAALFAQEEEPMIAEPIISFAKVEPQYPGGEQAMMQFISENVQYPAKAMEKGEQGTVYIQFIVTKTGEINDVQIMRGVSAEIDAEAVRVIKKRPKWTPGEQAGKPISVRYTLPIVFRLG